eukprot:3531672-Pyramimonas_sp.AAC.1
MGVATPATSASSTCDGRGAAEMHAFLIGGSGGGGMGSFSGLCAPGSMLRFVTAPTLIGRLVSTGGACGVTKPMT